MKKFSPPGKNAPSTSRFYGRALLGAAASHVIYLALFLWLRMPAFALYNVASALLYALLQLSARKGRYKLIYFSVHIEVCLYSTLAALLLGWEYGFQYLLICLTSLSYFCPTKNKYFPYLLSAGEMLLFIFLRVFTMYAPHYLTSPASDGVVLAISIVNSCVTFGIIIFASLLANLSTTVTRMEMMEKNRALRELAGIDGLTGLPNRRSMLAHLKRALRAYRDSGVPFAVIMGDIDDFKQVNDTFGHDCGDCLLRQLAQMMQRCMRKSDIASRWGGEEFLLLLPGAQEREAAALMERLRLEVAQNEFTYHSVSLNITMTFGVSGCGDGSDLHSIFLLADERMYEGKHSGKNRVVGPRS